MRHIGLGILFAATCALGCDMEMVPSLRHVPSPTLSAPRSARPVDSSRLDAQATEPGLGYLIEIASCSLTAVHGEVIQLEALVLGTDEPKSLVWKAVEGEITETGRYTAPSSDSQDTITVSAAEDPSISDSVRIQVGPKPTLSIKSASYYGCSDPRYVCGVSVSWSSSYRGAESFQVCLISSDGNIRDCTTYGSTGGSYTTSVGITRGTFGTPLYLPKYVRITSLKFGGSVTKAF